MPATWHVLPPMPPNVPLAGAGYDRVLAQLLYNRGITSPSEAHTFLSQDMVRHDPRLLPGIDQAIPRLRKAISHGERIAVFGDFDVDGITATALLARGLKPLGVGVLPYIPHRVKEGHGLSMAAIEGLVRQSVDVLITVDCGVTSYQEIDAAQAAGMDVIVTDHHLAPEGAPNACAVVDHQLPGSRYPFPHLTGAGTALKLVQALFDSLPQDTTQLERPLLPLAALGTVADVALLVDENRSIVRQGLQEMSRSPTAGIRALMRTARLENGVVDTEAISWNLAPRLNAAGRIGHADTSYQLLVTESDEEATRLADILEHQNRTRRTMTSKAYDKAATIVEPGPLVMVADSSFSPGIIGLVASRLVEEFHRPAVVVGTDGEISRGSCRTIPEFDIGSALHRVASEMDGFIRHGGHPQAAGFTIKTASLPELRSRLSGLAETLLGASPPGPRLEIDLDTPLRNLPRSVYKTIQSLAPFGAGNRSPVFLSRNVQPAEVRQMGANGDHMRMKLRDQGMTWDAVAFRLGGRISECSQALDFVYSIEVDRWDGKDTLRLNVRDFRPAV